MWDCRADITLGLPEDRLQLPLGYAQELGLCRDLEPENYPPVHGRKNKYGKVNDLPKAKGAASVSTGEEVNVGGGVWECVGLSASLCAWTRCV